MLPAASCPGLYGAVMGFGFTNFRIGRVMKARYTRRRRRREQYVKRG